MPAARWMRGRFMRRELELFLDSVLRSDQSVTTLLTADYTYLNETLARSTASPP